ncbi:hypothetical protein F3K52_08135, partial [Pseudomonas lactis]
MASSEKSRITREPSSSARRSSIRPSGSSTISRKDVGIKVCSPRKAWDYISHPPSLAGDMDRFVDGVMNGAQGNTLINVGAGLPA